MRLGILIGSVLIWMCTKAQYPKLLVPVGHTSGVQSAIFSSDGKKILTSGDETAKIWDANTGRLLVDFKGHSFWVVSAAFSPNEKKIVTASADKTAKVWDAETGKLLQDLKGHTSKVNSAFFSPDGNRVVTASDDETAMVWDVETGKTLQALKHTSEVRCAVFSPDGANIITGCLGGDATVRIWNAETGRQFRTLKSINTTINKISFSSDWKKIALFNSLNAENAIVKVWSAEIGPPR